MNRRILRLAIPNILSNLSVPFLSIVDTAVVGHLENISHLGAIAIGGMIFNFLYLGLGFLRMGTSGLTAQAFGSEDDEEVMGVLGRALTVSISFAFILILFQYPISAAAFNIVDASGEVELFAKEYFAIRIFAAPATLSLYAFHGWFLGMQNAKYPLYLSLIVNLSNVAFNLFFIYSVGMKSDGVALGTVFAQWFGLAVAVFLYLKKYSKYNASLRLKRILNPERFKKFFSVNFDIFIRTVILIFVMSFFTAKSAQFGETVLAANTILMQLWMLIAYGVDGFAFSAESLVGNFIGAKEKANLKKVIQLTFYWALGLGAVVTFSYLLFNESILRIFTNNDEVISTALLYFIFVAVSPILNSISFIWDGIYIGATATRAMRNAMMASALFFFPLFYLLVGEYQNYALWIALVTFMAARGLSLTLLARRCIFERV